jgi:hypothetical protein
MDTRFSISAKQLILILLLAVLVTAGLTTLIFYIGQQSGLRLAGGIGQSTTTPTMPPLPKAMTATPREKQAETFFITEGMIDDVLAQESDPSAPVTVEQVEISDQQVQVDGQINYMGYQGALAVSGTPYVADHKMRVDISAITLDGQTLPALLYPTVEQEVNRLFDELMVGYDVQAVELADGQIVVIVVPW